MPLCHCGDPSCPSCSVSIDGHYGAFDIGAMPKTEFTAWGWNTPAPTIVSPHGVAAPMIAMLSRPKAQALLWLLRTDDNPPSTIEWSKKTHEGTSRALQQANMIRATERGIELTVFGFGVATGLSWAVRNAGALDEIQIQPKEKTDDESENAS